MKKQPDHLYIVLSFKSSSRSFFESRSSKFLNIVTTRDTLSVKLFSTLTIESSFIPTVIYLLGSSTEASNHLESHRDIVSTQNMLYDFNSFHINEESKEILFNLFQLAIIKDRSQLFRIRKIKGIMLKFSKTGQVTILTMFLSHELGGTKTLMILEHKGR